MDARVQVYPIEYGIMITDLNGFILNMSYKMYTFLTCEPVGNSEMVA